MYMYTYMYMYRYMYRHRHMYMYMYMYVYTHRHMYTNTWRVPREPADAQKVLRVISRTRSAEVFLAGHEVSYP